MLTKNLYFLVLFLSSYLSLFVCLDTSDASRYLKKRDSGVRTSASKIQLNERLGSVDRNALMPNFYFFGVSKCGTSTLAALLTEHPLIAGVGSDKKEGGESKLLEFYSSNEINKINTLQTDRTVKHLLKRNDTVISEILKRGIIMHYTPNYSSNELALQNLFKSISYYNSNEKSTDKKYLMMIRDPMTRTSSSWWFKEWSGTKPSKSIKSRFKPILEDGIAREKKLQDCFKSHGFNFSQMVKTSIGIEQMHKSNVLQNCRLSMLNADGYDERRAHIGKSLYAQTLIHWMEKIPLDNIYVMTLEGFSKDAAHETEMLLNWLGIETYGSLGFKSPVEINQRAKALHIHNRPINSTIYDREIRPILSTMSNFFEPSIKDLQNILGDYFLRKIEQTKHEHHFFENTVISNSSIRQNDSSRYINSSSSFSPNFAALIKLSKSESGSWSDVVNLLSALHSLKF